MATIYDIDSSFAKNSGYNGVNFSSIEELLTIPFVAQWKEKPGFYRFSQTSDFLMAEFDQGNMWWIVGIMDESSDIQLPQFYG